MFCIFFRYRYQPRKKKNLFGTALILKCIKKVSIQIPKINTSGVLDARLKGTEWTNEKDRNEEPFYKRFTQALKLQEHKFSYLHRIHLKKSAFIEPEPSAVKNEIVLASTVK